MLSWLALYVTHSILGLASGSHLAYATEFYIYDTIKIFLLLSVIIFAVSAIGSYFPPERTKKILSHKKKFIGNVTAPLPGIVTPFCSCPAVPADKRRDQVRK